ncbi:tetratricopeptide repeat protein [Azospirillum sp. SYSU D00513]|uniref:O-linked N-acetylglucosamine transferase family protein n=1 Tax=Azospirillum sp. SYSU D00513 TaxID=2812561 RepID=UPI001A97209A|nr:tetratricopeptide repeat protein [Azospirillum sp. SYSU D00513]
MTTLQARKDLSAALLAQAAEHARAGRLTEAEADLCQLLTVDPAMARAHYALGTLRAERQRPGDAARSFARALRLLTFAVEPLGGLGAARLAIGDPAGAAVCFERILTVDPADPAAWTNFAVARARAGMLDAALDAFHHAVWAAPSRPDPIDNLARALRLAGRTKEALALCRDWMSARGEHPAILQQEAEALLALDRAEDALRAAGNALRLQPDRTAVHMIVAMALAERGDHHQAGLTLEWLIARAPNHEEAWRALARLRAEQGQRAGALAALRGLVALSPADEEAWRRLGQTLLQADRTAEAAGTARRAALAAPDSAAAHLQHARCLSVALYKRATRRMASRRPADAEVEADADAVLDEAGAALERETLAAHRRALALAPWDGGALADLAQLLQRLYDWPALDGLLERMRALANPFDGLSPFFVMATGASPEAQFRCARRTAAAVAARMESRRKFLNLGHRPVRGEPRGERLRVGYLSADFGDHATSYLIAEMLERHDRARIEVFAYSIGPAKGGDWRRRIEAAVDGFVELDGLSHEDAALRIHADAIDVLVDLKGYTYQARPEILALRPAPVQIAYLGYPGTTGAPFIDFAILDRTVAPPEVAEWFSEEPLFLPDCYQVNDRRRPRPATGPNRAACGLPEQGTVFCAFHSSYKITPTLFAVWMELLRNEPDSVLWLLDYGDTATANLRAAAVAQGVAAERLVFASLLPLEPHLARLRLADLFLDTLPVAAHTTASDALWMGCPVVSCAGNSMIGRVSASLLRAVGLPELVAPDLAGYRALALDLARRPKERARLRRHLDMARDTAPLFDSAKTTRELERLYEEAWKRVHGNPLPTTHRGSFRLVRMMPPGYRHAAAFDEAMEAVASGLRALGFPVETADNQLSGNATNVLFGANLVPPAELPALPPDTILYNLEPLALESPLVRPGFLDLLHRHRVWDYSRANVTHLRRLGLGRDVRHIPLGHAPELARIAPAPVQDVDVLFYGSPNERRRRVLDALRARGLRVEVLFGVYGAERDAWIARTKTVLCLHFYEGNALEMARIAYLLNNGKAVVAEVTGDDEVEPELADALVAVPYEGLVGACAALVADDDRRHALEWRAAEAFARRPMAEIVGKALAAPRASAEAEPELGGLDPSRRPTFSIIVPDYDGSVPRPHVERMLRSLAAQSCRDFEVVLLHDGPRGTSAAPTAADVPNLAVAEDTSFRFGDWGHSLRDIGLRRARGRYILHLNADNVLYPEALAEILAVFRRRLAIGSYLADGLMRDINRDRIAIFPVYMVGLQTDGTNVWQENRDDPSVGLVLSGYPPAPNHIDCMQLVMERSLWLGYGGWYDKSYAADGTMYARFVADHGAKYAGRILGEHW